LIFRSASVVDYWNTNFQHFILGRRTTTMLNALSTLLACQLAGELIARAAHVPIPGPLIGMLLLFAWLLLRGGPSPELDRFSGNLLSWLALLFVPAATGLVVGLNQLATDWWRIALAIVGSTVAGLATTAWVMNSLDSMFSRSRKQP
jgi:holin-like protein